MRTVELFPFVPTTCTARKARCGLPSAVSSRRIRSSPNFMPNSSSESRWSSACSSDQLMRDRPGGEADGGGSFERPELGLEPGELLALGLDHLRGRLGDEALVGELALGPGDLALEPLALRGGAPRLGLGVDGVGGEDRDRAARDRDAR